MIWFYLELELIGHDPKEFRHYGPMAQDFFAGLRPRRSRTDRLGDDDQLRRHGGDSMIAVQALEKRTAELKQKEAQMAVLESIKTKSEARLDAHVRVATETVYPDRSREKASAQQMVDVMP